MTKTVITRNKANKLVNSKAVRSMAKYIKTHGQYRSGLTTTTDGGQLIPSEIVSTAQDLSANQFKLKPYLNYIPVTTAKGDYPVMNPTATASTKEELEKLPSADAGIDVIPFKVSTMASRIQLSQELLSDDDNLSLVPMLSKELSTIMVNTQNKIISEKLATLPAKKVTSMDDVVKAITGDIDPRFMKTVFVGQGAYGKLRTMKDSQNRYLLDSNANTLCGLPVVVVPNLVGNSNDIFVGDLKTAMAYFDRGNVSLNYANNNLFAQSLALVMRADVQFTYKPAIERLSFDDVNGAGK